MTDTIDASVSIRGFTGLGALDDDMVRRGHAWARAREGAVLAAESRGGAAEWGAVVAAEEFPNFKLTLHAGQALHWQYVGT